MDFITKCTCANCAQAYPVELRRMRLNLNNLCPACGFPNSISEDEAFRA
jgi:Zn finger protein HypA/HybF involved in hydrogenase expression